MILLIYQNGENENYQFFFLTKYKKNWNCIKLFQTGPEKFWCSEKDCCLLLRKV